MGPTSLFTILFAVIQVRAKDFYTAAVVEYSNPKTPLLPADQVMIANAATYVDFMANASISEVDIIIFPEGGLHGHGNRNKFIELPPPSADIAPCDNNGSYHIVLERLSCAARQYRMYTVINLSESAVNTTTNITDRYNSNLVFDRDGVVVGRYRKFNPYGEPVTKPSEPDHHTFTTDFGVRFGMFTCFDIEFKEPGVALAHQYGVSHFVFPHCWISELPFLTAMQAQWGWAYSLDAVLLAAGCNQPEAGGSGTGVYYGKRGALATFQTDLRISNMLIARVPVTNRTGTSDSNYFANSDSKMQQLDSPQPSPRHSHSHVKDDGNSSGLVMLRDYLDVYETFVLAADRTNNTLLANTSSTKSITEIIEKTICQNSLCCDFKINVTSLFSSTPSESSGRRGDDFTELHYRLGVFDGVRWYGGGLATGGVQVCGVFSCANDSILSCGLRADVASSRQEVFNGMYKIATVFEYVSISGKFTNKNAFSYPDIFVTGSGDNFGALLSSEHVTYDIVDLDDHSQLSLSTRAPTPALITAAIYSRQFDRDGQPRTELSRAHAEQPPQILFIFVILACVSIYIIL